MNKTVLTFGFLPIENCGKQKNGLAYGIYNLVKFLTQADKNSTYYLGAIDVKKNLFYTEGFFVMGWTYRILLKYSILEVYRIPQYITSAIKIRKIAPYYKLHIILFKLIFFSYLIKKIKPNIIHFHGCDDALISIYLSHHTVKRILRLHGINGFDENIKNYERYRKVEQYITSNGNFDMVTFISTTNMNYWIRKYGRFNSLHDVIINGFDTNLFYLAKTFKRKKDGKINLLTIGKIGSLKGQKRVIKAISMIEEPSKFRYTIIGKCYNNEDSIDDLVSKANFEINLIDYLPQNELNKYISQADYFILPSSSEGFGMVFIESIACGTPVILPKHLPLANENGILNGKNSILLEDESVESILHCLKYKLFQNYDRYVVADSVKHLTWENTAKQYLQKIIKLSSCS